MQRKLLGLMVLIMCQLAFAATPPDLNQVLVQSPDVITLDGKTVKLASMFKAGAPLLIELWATWCIPCIRLAPDIADLHKQYVNKGLQIIGLSLDDPSVDLDKVQTFIREHHLEYAVAFLRQPQAERLLGRKRISVPDVLIYDGAGKLIYANEGEHFRDKSDGERIQVDHELIENAIKKALVISHQ